MQIRTRHRNPSARRLKRQLESSGRTVTWLAKQTGYNRTYISKVFSGALPETNDFVVKVGELLDLQQTETVEYLGMPIRMPSKARFGNVTLPDDLAEDYIEGLWKKAWYERRSAEYLAREAERQWQLAKATGLSV
jgi:hypothetical protein